MTTPTKEQLDAAYRTLGLPVGEEAASLEAKSNARILQQEAAQIVEAAEAAVESGEVSAARAASLILSAGTPAAVAAHDTFLDRTRAAEAAQHRVESLVEALDSDSIADYAAEYEQRRYNDQVKAAEELQAAQDALGQKRLEGLTAQFQKFVEHTPGADAKRIGNLLREHVESTQSIPETDADKMRLVRESAHTINVADSVISALREQARATVRAKAHEWARTDAATTTSAWNQRIADAEEEHFQRLLETTPVSPEALELPLTAEEEKAKVVEQISAKNDKQQSYVESAHRMFTRGGRPEKEDRGEYISEDRARYKEALARAESNAVPYVPPEPKAPQFDEYGPIGPGS